MIAPNLKRRAYLFVFILIVIYNYIRFQRNRADFVRIKHNNYKAAPHEDFVLTSNLFIIHYINK